jgi:phosphoribosylcarboxyaminoimidazole (NCAIR) mutase
LAVQMPAGVPVSRADEAQALAKGRNAATGNATR